MKFVGVHPLTGFDKLLHYKVPTALERQVTLGSLVRIPLGRRFILGIVGSEGAPTDFPLARLKYLTAAIYDFPALPPDLLALAKWMAVYYAAPLDGIIDAMLPPAVRRAGRLKQERQLAVREKLPPAELAKLHRRAPQQAKLYEFLAGQFQPVARNLVLKRLGVGPSSAAALVKRGVLEESSHRVKRIAYDDEFAAGELVAAMPHQLNEEQAAAFAAVKTDIARRKFGVTLLQGVTGSGKTEVYLRAMQETLGAGGGVVFLVPEVALTPQTVARLRSRLEAIAPGHTCVVWHSHLSEGERVDGWHDLATGVARIVVGPRSAVFAPVHNLSLIVVDEEHEPVYKQDETPRYHGRDVAVMRAKLNEAHCLLGSATPSLESYANARAGRYAHRHLTQRVDDRQLPFIDVVDMRVEIMRSRGAITLSRKLVDEMQDRLARREQTILFLNRRGYSPSMLCRACGHVEECPHCSITVTYHRSDELLRCHLCGHERPAPTQCPQCRSPEIRWRGSGTQRVEEAVRRVMSRARVERMDGDTMRKKNRFRQVLAQFRAGKIDVLVGTQMIGKGLDFPNVTLVGLVDADLSMHLPDFRAHERTFQLLVQVAGRAGRGDRAGVVVVQTFNPHAEAIQFSRQADFDGFAAAELQSRQEFRYPPYRHLIHHAFRGPNPEKLRFFAEEWVRQVKREFGDRIEVRGPSPSAIEKIKDNYRFQVWYFTPGVTRVIGDLNTLRQGFAWPKDVIQVLDVDPVSLM